MILMKAFMKRQIVHTNNHIKCNKINTQQYVSNAIDVLKMKHCLKIMIIPEQMNMTLKSKYIYANICL